jgi:hypothetical protein
MIVNRLLVRYKRGWIAVEDTASITAYGVSAGKLTLGDVESQAEATRIAQAHLLKYATPETQIDLTVDPRASQPDDRVWWDWDLGDYVNAPDRSGSMVPYRVVGLTISTDELGAIVIQPTLSSLIEEQAIRTWRWLRRMAPGTLGGRSESATLPVPADSIITRQARVETATFSFSGPLVEDEVSPVWRPTANGRLVAGVATLETRDTSNPVEFRLFTQTGFGSSHASSPIGTYTIPAGQSDFPIIIGSDLPVGQGVKVQTTDPAVTAEGLTVQLSHLRWEGGFGCQDPPVT